MEWWLYCGWMGDCVELWTCMCTCISIHACLYFNLASCPSRVRSVFYFRDCVGSPFWFEATHFFVLGVIFNTIGGSSY